MSTNPVSDAVSSASSVLKNAFGEDAKVQGEDAFRYLDVNILSKIYEDELKKQNISQFISTISGSINSMRSSYLPLDLVQELALGLNLSVNQVLTDATSERESFENTFLRMLGMPDSEEISGNTNITVVNSSGEELQVSFEIVEAEILNERQKPRTERKIVVNNSIYNMDAELFNNDNFNEPETEEVEVDQIILIPQNQELEELSDSTPPILSQIENEIFKYSYLLIPPVQDSRISGCINESKKIVPPNFSNPRGHQINSEKIVPSLLESIIRIRLDRLSGRSNPSFVENQDEDLLEVKGDDYGILESLFIIRLRSALKAFASKINDDIEHLREIYQQTGKIPVARNTVNGSLSEKEDDTISASYEETQNGEGELAAKRDISLLEQQRVIEDSVMALLDDNTEVLDLQVQTQRKSSIKNSHLMSGLLGIIDLPRQRLFQAINDEQTNQNRVLEGPGDRQREDISLSIGTSKGIGAVDILIFVLALFTMPETQLLGLLDNLEYERFKEEFAGAGDTGGIFGGFGGSEAELKVETAEAVNTLTEYLLAGYKLLKEDIRDDDSGLGIEGAVATTSTGASVANIA